MVITTAILTNFFSLIKIGKNRQNVVVKIKLHLKIVNKATFHELFSAFSDIWEH